MFYLNLQTTLLVIKVPERCDSAWAAAMFARLGAWWAHDLRPPSQEKKVAGLTLVLQLSCKYHTEFAVNCSGEFGQLILFIIVDDCS